VELATLPDWVKTWLHNHEGSENGTVSEPMPSVSRRTSGKADVPYTVCSVRGSAVQKRPLEWIWPGWLPLGKLTDLSGDPGLSKSTLLLDIAARVTTHGLMPDGQQGIGDSGVCILSAEDGIEDTLVPRLQAAGADLSRVGFIQEYAGQPVIIPDHLDRLALRLKDYGARLLLIDPLAAYLARAKSDQEIRKCLHPLKKMAEELRCTPLWLRHLNKGGAGKALYRGSGFISIIGAARVGWLVGEDPHHPATRVLANSKNNLAERQKSLTYTVHYSPEHQATTIQWGGPSDLSADDLCAFQSSRDRETREEEKTKVEAAVEFLNEALRSGPRVVEELREEARTLGLSWHAIRRAVKKVEATTIYPHQTATRKHEWILSHSRCTDAQKPTEAL
jgi:hypothetical protein